MKQVPKHAQPLTVFRISVSWESEDKTRESHTYRTFARNAREIRDHYQPRPGVSRLDLVEPVKPTIKEVKRLEAINHIRKIVRPGDVLRTILKKVSASGMSRIIDVYAVTVNKGQASPFWLSAWVAQALEWTRTDRPEGIRIGGCGMDMGFHLVYSLSHTLYPYGFDCAGKRCRANDHSNGAKTRHHHDGGYALRQEWM